jgi:hypothetical protein
VEFVSHDEVVDLLGDYGIEEVAEGSDRIFLRMAEGEGVVRLHLADKACTTKPAKGARVIPIPKDRLAHTLEGVIRVLHLRQVLLVPVGKWRKVFDAVAFSLASNHAWQEMDATATVELNTRDPLLCEPGDFHLLTELVATLLRDAEAPEQGLMFIATTSPVLVEVVPSGAVRLSVGSQALADEVADVFAKKA